MRMILLGMEKEVLSSPALWQCNQCHACVAHCPQNVRFADVMRVLRELAVEDGYFTRQLADEVDSIDIETRKQRIEKIRSILT